jgi:opacity protein-like surface antigen
MRPRTFMFLLALMLAAATPVLADEIVYQAALGASAIWFDNEARPSDVEGSINGSASLSPHISAVANAAFGFDHSYVSGAAGLRFTVTDAMDRDFSIGLGIQRHMSSEPALRPEEWAPDVSVGWRPWSSSPRVILAAISSYGLDSNTATVSVGVRYKFTGEYIEQGEVTP